MSLQGMIFSLTAAVSDRRRDAAIPLPEGVECRLDLPYREGRRLDVYVPEGTSAVLPTIVSIHGGGYVYGSKEIYRRYGMDLARRGFAFVNFDYRLAPRHRFPAPLEDTNAVMEWICANAGAYHLDPDRILLVGDSAGAQMASQYAAILTNPEYGAQFSFRTPPVTVRALGLNCGEYDLASEARRRRGFVLDYLGRELDSADPRLQVLDAIGSHYPPVFLTTACHDFLREHARPMYELLRTRGVPAEVHCYGTQEDKTVAHVFHVNIRLPEAVRCNDEECAFFRRWLKT